MDMDMAEPEDRSTTEAQLTKRVDAFGGMGLSSFFVKESSSSCCFWWGKVLVGQQENHKIMNSFLPLQFTQSKGHQMFPPPPPIFRPS
jgi:hypothetical protein